MFRVEDRNELLALHRALFSAKFGLTAPPEFAGSPFLAAMSERALDAVVQLVGGQGENWAEWRRAESHPEELAFVRERLSACRRWSDWNPGQRQEFVHLLLSPLHATDSTIQELLAHADARHPKGSKPKFFIRSILHGIRQRPQMYFGQTKHPFTSLCGYLEGYTSGCGAAKPEMGCDEAQTGRLVPDEFHQFVAQHFGEADSSGGWRHHISQHTKDEQAAFDLFFELLTAYERQASIV